MLTGKMVRVRYARDRIIPVYLDTQDSIWQEAADRLLALFRDQEGRTRGEGAVNRSRGSPTAGCSAMSPGRATTDTPRRDSAVWTAISRIRGIWSGWETISQ